MVCTAPSSVEVRDSPGSRPATRPVTIVDNFSLESNNTRLAPCPCWLARVTTNLSPIQDSKMGVPEAVLEKVGSLPDIAAMSKDDLSALCKKLYDQGCSVFGEKFDVEYQVKKRDMEIHNLEMETSESHGTFKIPKLKKVNKFKPLGDEEESK